MVENNPTRKTHSRRRGSGSIYQLPGCSTWTIQFYRGGKRIREATGSTDRRAAQQLLTRRLASVDKGEVIDLRKITVAELYVVTERDYQIQGRKSLADLRIRWRLHLEPFFGSMNAANVYPRLLNEYVDRRLNEGAQNGTVNRELALLKRAFRLGMKNGITTQMPTFPDPLPERTRKGFVTEEEFARLTEHAVDLAERLYLEIAFKNMWRKASITHLRVRDCDFNDRTIMLATSKNGSPVIAVMGPTMYLLAKQAAAGKQPDELLLTDSDSKPIHDLRFRWKELLKRAGLNDILIHDLRRSGARNARRKGLSESTIMAVGGWKTASIFKRYDIHDITDLRIAAARLEQNSHDLSHDLPKHQAEQARVHMEGAAKVH